MWAKLIAPNAGTNHPAATDSAGKAKNRIALDAPVPAPLVHRGDVYVEGDANVGVEIVDLKLSAEFDV